MASGTTPSHQILILQAGRLFRDVPLVSARHRMHPAETEDIVYQGSRIAVPPSAHGRGGVQTARVCHRTAVLLVNVSAGGSLLWSPLVAPSASAAMKTQRSQAAATSRPLGPSSRRASANGCSARGLLGELSGTV